MRVSYANDAGRKILQQSFLVLLGTIVALTLLIGRIVRSLSRYIATPIRALSQTLARSEPSEIFSALNRDMPLAAVKEVNILYKAISSMSQRLAAYQDERISRTRIEALSEQASQVAHDIRSPLAALDSALDDLNELSEQKRLLIRSAVGRMRDIANNLIHRNRLLAADETDGAGGRNPGSPLLLSSLVDSLISEKRVQFRHLIGVEIESRLDGSSYGLFAKVSVSDLMRVLSNLVDNAVEALPGAGKVAVRLAMSGQRVEIRVDDDGRGIPPELLGRLGRKGETHGKPGGSGLGLYHAKSTVESWGGSLTIDSHLGKGTSVIIQLPNGRAPGWFVSELVIPARTIVVILDDDMSIHQVWRGRLEAIDAKVHGIEIVNLSTPDTFRSLLAGTTPGLSGAIFLLDHELVGYPETGLGLAEEFGIGARSILVTSRFEEADILRHASRLKARLIPKSLAGFVPIRIAEVQCVPRLDAVLIDDDPLVRTTWNLSASRAGKAVRAYSSIEEFLAEADAISRESPVYVDVELSAGMDGASESRRIWDRGFSTIYLATGHSARRFDEFPHLRGVVGKNPPWMPEDI